VAIRNDKIKAALILLDDGADVNIRTHWPEPGPPLLEALRNRNKTVVEKILEADVDINSYYQCHAPDMSTMESAGFWGDISIVEDLIFMGADIDAGCQATALAAAVKSRNRILVEMLLKLGASSSIHAPFGVSPLAAAIANEDDDMIRLLFESGADPACSSAFLSASETNQRTFNTLLETFSARYPQGKNGFGADLLIKAIEKRDDTLLNNILAAKFDVNGFSKQTDTLLTAFGFAIMYRKGTDLKLVQQLIDAGGNPNAMVRRPNDIRRDQPNHIRVDQVEPQETALMVAIKTRSKEMVKLLLKNGANVHQTARRGLKRTPLQQACEIGSFKMVKLLVERGQVSTSNQRIGEGHCLATGLH
jgi:ankyrin repeat protein